MAEMYGLDALIAIRAEFPDASDCVTITRVMCTLSARSKPVRRVFAQEHAPLGLTADHPSGPCRKEESVT